MSQPNIVFDAQFQSYAASSVLCWLASCDAQGQPNVSPKEIFLVCEAPYIVVANIASPNTVRNVRANPKVCLSFIDIFVQKGHKVLGLCDYITRGDAHFEQWASGLMALAEPKFKLAGVFVIKATQVQDIVAPSYTFYADQVTQTQQIASAMQTYGVMPAPHSPKSVA